MINKKVGRPRKINNEYFKMLRTLYPDIKTRRGILNKYYETVALQVIGKMKDTTFIIDESKQVFKASILSEIGRLENEEDIKIVARYICNRAKKEKKTIHQWVNIIRFIRATRKLI